MAELSSKGLFIRLAGLLTFALFPLGSIALWQTWEVAENATELSEAAVLAATERGAADERRLLERARGAARALSASTVLTLDDPAECSTLMNRFVSAQDIFVFAGFIRADGMMECSSNGVTVDYADDDRFVRALEHQEEMFEVNAAGDATGQSVVIVSNPVFGAGRLLGFVSISLPHNLAAKTVDRTDSVGVAKYVSVNRNGTILSSSLPIDQATSLLPSGVDPASFVGSGNQTFLGTSKTGKERVFAIAEMIPGEVVVIGSWPVGEAIGGIGASSLWAPLIFPVAMWFAGISVAFVGVNTLVIQHIYRLRHAMRRFARGDRSDMKLAFDNPPREFEVLETSFNRMVRIITAAEEKSGEDLQEKTVLLREVHHRVKNNLQLIASIMNMHGRVAETPEARQLLSKLQRRVRGLATVHQTMNSTTQMTSVNSQSLLDQLINELAPPFPVAGHNVAIQRDVMPMSISPDQAVVFSMLAAEVLTNAVKYVGKPKSAEPALHVIFEKQDSAAVRFAIFNTKGDRGQHAHTDFVGTGIGQKLMVAFVAQLNGVSAVQEDDDSYLYQVTFPVTEFEGDPMADVQETAADTTQRPALV